MTQSNLLDIKWRISRHSDIVVNTDDPRVPMDCIWRFSNGPIMGYVCFCRRELYDGDRSCNTNWRHVDAPRSMRKLYKALLKWQLNKIFEDAV